MHAVTETGHLLHEDHRRAIDILNCVEAFLKETSELQPASTASPNVRRLLNDLRWLTGHLPPHFMFEERAIFPILEAGGADALTSALRQDHDVLRLLARRVGALCDLAIRDGFDAEAWPAFHAFAGDLAHILFMHLQTEETTMLEAVESALDREADRALAESYRLTVERSDLISDTAVERGR